MREGSYFFTLGNGDDRETVRALSGAINADREARADFVGRINNAYRRKAITREILEDNADPETEKARNEAAIERAYRDFLAGLRE